MAPVQRLLEPGAGLEAEDAPRPDGDPGTGLGIPAAPLALVPHRAEAGDFQPLAPSRVSFITSKSSSTSSALSFFVEPLV